MLWRVIFGILWISRAICFSRRPSEVRVFCGAISPIATFSLSLSFLRSAYRIGISRSNENGEVPLEIGKEFIDKVISTQSKIERLSQSILDVLTGNYNSEKEKILTLPKDIAWIVLQTIYGNIIESKSGGKKSKEKEEVARKLDVSIWTGQFSLEGVAASIKGYFDEQMKEKCEGCHVKREIELSWS